VFTSLALPRAHAQLPLTPRAWMSGRDLARGLRRRLLPRAALRGFGAGLTGAVLLCAAQAQAAGSSMPWEEPLQRILESIEGPVAKIIAVIIIIVTGLSLAFGDSSGGARKLIQIVFGLSIAFAASSFFLSFFSFGGGALV
jgi:type IV secretory pathway VirB2 component (pilin)